MKNETKFNAENYIVPLGNFPNFTIEFVKEPKNVGVEDMLIYCSEKILSHIQVHLQNKFTINNPVKKYYEILESSVHIPGEEINKHIFSKISINSDFILELERYPNYKNKFVLKKKTFGKNMLFQDLYSSLGGK